MIRRSYMGVWCDYCKLEWGKLKSGQWHPKAQAQAVVTIESSNGLERSYCRKCMDEVSNWPDGTTFSVVDQVNYANAHRPKVVANV